MQLAHESPLPYQGLSLRKVRPSVPGGRVRFDARAYLLPPVATVSDFFPLSGSRFSNCGKTVSGGGLRSWATEAAGGTARILGRTV